MSYLPDPVIRAIEVPVEKTLLDGADDVEVIALVRFTVNAGVTRTVLKETEMFHALMVLAPHAKLHGFEHLIFENPNTVCARVLSRISYTTFWGAVEKERTSEYVIVAIVNKRYVSAEELELFKTIFRQERRVRKLHTTVCPEALDEEAHARARQHARMLLGRPVPDLTTILQQEVSRTSYYLYCGVENAKHPPEGIPLVVACVKPKTKDIHAFGLVYPDNRLCIRFPHAFRKDADSEPARLVSFLLSYYGPAAKITQCGVRYKMERSGKRPIRQGGAIFRDLRKKTPLLQLDHREIKRSEGLFTLNFSGIEWHEIEPATKDLLSVFELLQPKESAPC